MPTDKPTASKTVQILGRTVGFASSIEPDGEEFWITLHDFEPIGGLQWPTGTLVVGFKRGVVEEYDDDDDDEVVGDAIDLVDSLYGRENLRL